MDFSQLAQVMQGQQATQQEQPTPGQGISALFGQAANPALGAGGIPSGAGKGINLAGGSDAQGMAFDHLVASLSKMDLSGTNTKDILGMLAPFMPKEAPTKIYGVVEDRPDGKYAPGEVPASKFGGKIRPGTTLEVETGSGKATVLQQPETKSRANQRIDEWAQLVTDSAQGVLDDPKRTKDKIKLDMITQQLTQPISWTDAQGTTHHEEGATVENINRYLQSLAPGVKFDKKNGLVADEGGGQRASSGGAANPMTPGRKDTVQEKPLAPEEINRIGSIKIAQKAAEQSLSKFFDKKGELDLGVVAGADWGIPWTEGRGAAAELVRSYDQYRHSVYGAALTEGEKAEWAKAYIPSLKDKADTVKGKLQAIWDQTHNYQEIYSKLGLRGAEVDKIIGKSNPPPWMKGFKAPGTSGLSAPASQVLSAFPGS